MEGLLTKGSKYNKKQKSNKPHSLKGAMSHVRGIPPSPNWGNKFTSIVTDNNLLYISNNYIINIDLKKKEFYQSITSNDLEMSEKFNVICDLTSDFILSITNNYNFIIIHKYFNTTNPEDKRVYYKEKKRIFRFSEINNTLITNTKEQILIIKSITKLSDKKLILCGDNQGNLHVMKFIIKKIDNENCLDIKFLYSISIVAFSNYITDIIYFENRNFLIFSTSDGELLKFSIFKENIVKIGCLNKSDKFIMSIDYMPINEVLFLLSAIDRNGSLFIYLLEFNDDYITHDFTNKLVLYEKNKFNDKSIDEKYLFFITKLIKSDSNNLKLIVTSNKGKIYFTEISTQDLNNQSEKINNVTKYKEITDNPHSMVIFNILIYNDKMVIVSADNKISFFKTPELLFEFDIKTLGTFPKSIYYENPNNRGIFLLNDSNQLFQYNYTKIFNGLMCSMRNNIIEKKNSKETSNIVLSKQANFNENIFALVVHNPNNYEYGYSIDIFYFLADLKLNKLKFNINSVQVKDTRIISLLFYPSRKIYNDDVDLRKDNQNEDGKNEVKNSKNAENLSNAINEIFSNNKEYDLLYIMDSNGIITIWDFISNKINKIQFTTSSIEYSIMYPLIFSYPSHENNNDNVFSISLKENNEISYSFINQMISYEICKFQNNKISESHNLSNELTTDYFISETDMFVFFIDNNISLKINHFNKDFFSIYMSINANSKSYSEYLQNFELYSKLNNLNRNIELSSITNMPIKNLEAFKIKSQQNSTTSINIQLMVSQSDNIIKIFDFAYNNITEEYKIKLKYSINAHLNKIIQIKWIDEVTIASTSLDHSLKLWNIQMCKPIDLIVGEFHFSPDNKEYKFVNEEKIKFSNNINKLNSMCLYQQSFKSSQDFLIFFENLFENLNSQIIGENAELKNELEYKNVIENYNKYSAFSDWLIFALFANTELNFLLADKIITFEIKNIVENSSNINKFLPSLINLILYSLYFNLSSINDLSNYIITLKKKLNDVNISATTPANTNKITIEQIEELISHYSDYEYMKLNLSTIYEEKYFINIQNPLPNPQKAIQILLENNLHVEALILFKLFKMNDYSLYISILEKLRSFIYPKQTFQSLKVQKVIEILNKYLNI